MPHHLGRLKIVTRRKDGQCRYKHCPVPDHALTPGEKTMVLTKMGNIPGKSVIFYKAYHPDCFGHWVLWMCEQTLISKSGRRKMELPDDAKEERAKLVRERARILRAIRYEVSGDELTRKVERITEVDRLINETGYPVLRYKGRRGGALVGFDKFIEGVKDKYGAEIRVPKSIWDEAKEMGMEPEFREAMDSWHQQDVEKTQSTDAETAIEDSEEQEE